MTDQHPITPPPELVQQWCMKNKWKATDIATQAAQWGADQELESCCAWVDYHCSKDASLDLRDARRPKPSLKEQALEALRDLDQRYPSSHQAIIVRRALEALDD